MFTWSECSQILVTLCSEEAVSFMRSDAYRQTFRIICSILRLLALLNRWEKTAKLILYISQFDFMLRLFAVLCRTKQDIWPKTVYILVSANSGKILIRLPSSLHINTKHFVCDIKITELPKESLQDAHFLESLWFGTDSNPLWFH